MRSYRHDVAGFGAVGEELPLVWSRVKGRVAGKLEMLAVPALVRTQLFITERKTELLERKSESLTLRLDEGFFEGPQLVEPVGS